jgi:VWFA-related protein
MIKMLRLVATCVLLIAVFASAQTPVPAPSGNDGKIYLNVVVTTKDGKPNAELQQRDFTLLDNKSPQPITSFRMLGGPTAPVRVVLVVDAVNTSYQVIAYERQQIDGFLKSNGGQLAHPTTLVVFTDTGTQIQKAFSNDGNALASDLDNHVIGLRNLTRSAGFYGAAERLQMSLTALERLVAQESTIPGRKLIVWVSPGWPLLTGPRIELSAKQQDGLFSQIVGLSTQMREANITLYAVDPRGTGVLGPGNFYYQEFLKGVSKPGQVQPADLSLQVLATQSGGQVLFGSNDVSNLLQKAVADAEAYYELSFQPPPSEKRDAYHSLEVKVDQSGLTARTRTGYYSHP